MLDNLHHTQPSRVLIDLAPALNALYSFTTVADADQSPGISEWSVQTRAKLTEEEWEKHQILSKWIGVEALGNVVQDEAAYASFSAYLEALCALDAEALRNELLYWMVARPGHRLSYKPVQEVKDHLSLLESWESFWAFHDYADVTDEKRAVGRQVFEYFVAPPTLQTLITSYLEHFWEEYTKTEWKRNLPQLEEALARFEQIDVTGMGHFEVIEAITHRNLRGAYRPEVLQSYSTLRFMPSPHSGPYIMKTCKGPEMRIAFGARHFRELARGAEAMDSARVVEQMKALADETRLEIIRTLKAEGELGTPDIIERLNLSKSAASRHLRQLYATGIIDARVEEDGLSKYYRLNPAAVGRMQVLLGNLLG
jgi:DNA-binding transcriptional ArsR family regulator